MTLCIAWIRQLKSTQELVIASDSRCRSIGAWDACPKVFPLPRNDSIICFANDTHHAYPMMIQIKNSIESHQKLITRGLDICDARGHFVRLMNQMRESLSEIEVYNQEAAIPSTTFIIGGYSWKTKKFKIWTMMYDEDEERFVQAKARKIYGNPIAIIGDDVEEIRIELQRKLREKKKRGEMGFDMEPFEVLRDKIRGGTNDSIGGPPQLAKVYEHMNVMPYGVFWPNKVSRTITLFGRTLMGYEIIRYPILDPDSLETSEMKTRNVDFISP
jgi:hypothetical protein